MTRQSARATADHEKLLTRILAGRKNVIVGRWKWGIPQTITTVDRVPPPPQYVPVRQHLHCGVARFADYLDAHAEHDAERDAQARVIVSLTRAEKDSLLILAALNDGTPATEIRRAVRSYLRRHLHAITKSERIQ